MVPFCLFLCSLVLPSELDCAKFEYSNSGMVSVSWEVVVNSEVQLPSAVAQCLPAPSLVNSSQIVFFDYVDNSGFLPSSAPWNLSCGLDQSDIEFNIESWLIRSGLLSSVDLWFWLLVRLVSLVFHADVLPSVCLFTSGSVEFIVYAAAMLFADAFSFVCRDVVGFALSGAALPCWQRCLSPTSNSLDEASCALFPGCNKGESKRKYQDWIVLFFSHFAFVIPVQVIFRSRAWVVGCGIQVAAAATIAVNFEKVAFPTAAALVYLVGAVAASCEGMLASAAAGIMFAFEGAYTLDEPYTVSAQFLLVSAAAAAFGCMCRSAAAGMPKAIVGMFTLEIFYHCVVVNDDDTIAGFGSGFASVQLQATPRVDDVCGPRLVLVLLECDCCLLLRLFDCCVLSGFCGSTNVWLHLEPSICSSKHDNSDCWQVHIREFLPVFSCPRLRYHGGQGVSFYLCAGRGATTGGRGRGPAN